MGWSTPNTAETQIHPNLDSSQDFETHTHPEPKEAIAKPLIGAGGVCPRLNPTHCIPSAIEAWWAHNPQEPTGKRAEPNWSNYEASYVSSLQPS